MHGGPLKSQEQALQILGQSQTNLEEIERESHNGREVWCITLSFPINVDQLAPDHAFCGGRAAV